MWTREQQELPDSAKRFFLWQKELLIACASGRGRKPLHTVHYHVGVFCQSCRHLVILEVQKLEVLGFNSNREKAGLVPE